MLGVGKTIPLQRTFNKLSEEGQWMSTMGNHGRKEELSPRTYETYAIQCLFVAHSLNQHDISKLTINLFVLQVLILKTTINKYIHLNSTEKNIFAYSETFNCKPKY